MLHGRQVCTLVGPKTTICALDVAWLPSGGTDGNGEDADVIMETLASNDAGDDDESSNDGDSGSDSDDDSEDEDAQEKSSGEWIVLAGCSNGIVREWSLSSLVASSSSGGEAAEVSPRRTFSLANVPSKNAVLLLACPSNGGEDGAVAYAVLGSKLVRFLVPPVSKEKKNSINLSSTTAQIGDDIASKVPLSLSCVRRPSMENENGYENYSGTSDDSPAATMSGDVFLVLCLPHSFVVVRDSSTAEDTDPVPFLMSEKASNNCSYTTIATSPNGSDMALGCSDGRIEVFVDLFTNVAAYLDNADRLNMSSDQHPSQTTLCREVHWHAHPVRTLAYSSSESALTLLSGGDESVLVTWQLDRQFHRPSQTLARVALGAILNVVSCSHNSGKIVVSCSDNTVRCVRGFDSKMLWMSGGLATAPAEEVGFGGVVRSSKKKRRHSHEGNASSSKSSSTTSPILLLDPITRLPLLANLPGAPGKIDWYDPVSRSVVASLEVSPYNRASTRDPDVDPTVPAPAVTKLGMSKDGRDLVTIDEVWTENASAGGVRKTLIENGGKGNGGGHAVGMCVCTTIKFWSYRGDGSGQSSSSSNGQPSVDYELVSALASPHGPEAEVSALAVSPDGTVACTLSRGENAFRIWKKGAVGAGITSTTAWKCSYRVKTPSGYANAVHHNGGGASLVSFSNDGSVLAVTYGSDVTLWDHTDASMLTSFTLGDSSHNVVRGIRFLTEGDGAVLLSTDEKVGMRSPFGGNYLGGDEWDARADKLTGLNGAGTKVTCVEPVSNFGGAEGCFVMAATNGKHSVVTIVNGAGENAVLDTKSGPVRWKIDGEVESMCCIGGGGGGGTTESASSSYRLLVITTDHHMFSLTLAKAKPNEDGTHARSRMLEAGKTEHQLSLPRGPALKDLGTDDQKSGSTKKRRKIGLGAANVGGGSVGEKADPRLGYDFPALSGAFTKDYIMKVLGAKER